MFSTGPAKINYPDLAASQTNKENLPDSLQYDYESDDVEIGDSEKNIIGIK